MNINELVTTGAIMSAVGTLIYSLRTIPMFLIKRLRRRFIYFATIYQYDDLYEALEKWLYKHHGNVFRDVEATLGIADDMPRTARRTKRRVSYKQEDALFLFKYQGRRIVIAKDRERIDRAQTSKEFFFRRFYIWGWFGRPAINALFEEVAQWYQSIREENTVKVHVHSSYGEWTNAHDIRVKPLSNVIIPENERLLLEKDVNKFLTGEQWYLRRGVPYKRGYCLYGPPGNGKTSLAQAIAASAERDIYMVSLNSFDGDSGLIRSFAQMGPDALILIEDIDKAYDGRETVGTKASFSALLNCLDGVLYKHGTITIITTNHFEKLDPALIRDGRMDLRLEIENPGQEEIAAYLQMFYGDKVTAEFLPGKSMAEIQGICMSNTLETAIQLLSNKSVHENETERQEVEQQIGLPGRSVA
jgi:mitochondrial chaperone BCS1